ncbi:MAG TPA: Flp pilus assembly complex ATPase component TadA [Dehalococcoidia bacterium]|nr:Flp pilus assembly complex ATPase component TadA [Dehalococcoidia bacterium]
MNQHNIWNTGDNIDFRQLENYTLLDRLTEEGEVGQLEIDPELKAQIKEYLRQQGYETTEGAKLLGKSGIEHIFDMLAQRDDGFTSHTLAVCIAVGGNREMEVGTIFSFANKAYDTSIHDRVLIAIPELSQEAKQLAQKQRIKVIDAEKLKSLLDSNPTLPVKPKEPFRFETKEQLVESLSNLGYRVEEKARVRGRSGVEYIFDILAYIDIDHVSHGLGIDLLTGEKEVGLEQISLFDTKAFEVGINDKAIVVSSGLSPEARQFAQHQQIKVLELGQEPIFQPTVTKKKPAPPEEKPTKSETPDVKSQAKSLRHAPQPEVLQLIPEVMARRYNAIPLKISGNTLHVAMADPTDIFALEAFAALSRMRVKTIASSAKEVREAIDFNYKGYGEIEQQLSRISTPGDIVEDNLVVSAYTDAPLAQALDLIVEEAVKARSSDIHIEPEEDRVRIRYRIDGTLQDMMSLPLNVHSALISRIKILSDMNIADRHRPQDGQFSTEAKGRQIDVRVATAPTVNGEMADLRLLDKSMATLGLSELGMLPDSLEKYESMLKVPYGMILTSGPTGAGKTTTLYASINSLDCNGRNVITIEDPAEYRFKDINQIEVNPQAGITFATGLKAMLRLDPDVIMVGEIRDAETAGIAVQAALTGHMMLSSVHANDAAGVLSRLVDLNIEPFLIASAVIGVVAQRMLRRICPDCNRPIEAPVIEQIAYEKEIGEKRTEFLYGTGCKSCAYTGYLGRTGIFEILTMSDAIRTMLLSRPSSSQIRVQAVEEGMITMMNDGMRKVKEGITTPSEVLRSAYSAG